MFDQVFQDRSIDWQSKKDHIRTLMSRESPQAQAAYAQHEAQRGQRRQQMEQVIYCCIRLTPLNEIITWSNDKYEKTVNSLMVSAKFAI